MKNKHNRRFFNSLLMMTIVLSFATAVILPMAAVAAEVKRVSQLMVHAHEEVTAAVETILPEFTYVESEVDSQMSGEVAMEFDNRCKIMYVLFARESVEEQTAIMATVINREENGDYPDNYYDVVKEMEPFKLVSVGGQCIGVEMEDVQTQTIEAVMDALCNGADPTELLLKEEAERLGLDVTEYAEGGALFFHHREECNEEELEAIKVKIQIGDYIFYKK